MSSVNNTNTPAADAAKAETEKRIAELAERYSKKEKLVALANDDMGDFIDYVSGLGGENVKQWNDGAPDTFTGMALVKSGGSNRLIAVPSMEAALADATVKNRFYKWYVNHVVNAAMDDDANPAQFITVAGTFKQKFDLDAYKFIAKAMVKKLREQGLLGITVGSLRLSLASEAYATSMFPRMTNTQWEGVLKVSRQIADAHGQDVSIFDHWEATRAKQTADVSTLELDFGKMETEIDADISDDTETETPVVAPANSTPAPAA